MFLKRPPGVASDGSFDGVETFPLQCAQSGGTSD